MYTWTRVVRFKNASSMDAAMPICLSIVEFMRDELGHDAGISTSALGGHPARAQFVVTSPDMDRNLLAFDRASTDSRFRYLLGKLADHIDGAATIDQVWKKVV